MYTMSVFVIHLKFNLNAIGHSSVLLTVSHICDGTQRRVIITRVLFDLNIFAFRFTRHSIHIVYHILKK